MVKLCLEPPVYQVGELLYSPTSAVVDSQGDRSRLRAREANLFHELIKTFPEVLSRSAIEETLWKDSYATNATINQTVKALRFSLQDVDRTLIRTIPKQGYVLAVAPHVDEDSVVPNIAVQNNPQSATTASLVEASNFDVQSQTVEIQNKTQENEPSAEKARSQSTTHSFNIVHTVTTLFAVGIATFALAASGIFVSSPERISHQYGEHWILFNASEQELRSLPIQPNESTKYVAKHESFYRICSEIKGVLECKKIDF